MDFLLKQTVCAESKDTNINTPIDIPVINSEEDAFEYLKHWGYCTNGKVTPFCFCEYCIKRADNSLHKISHQIFASTYVKGEADLLTDEQLALASEIITRENGSKAAIFRTFATPDNAKLLFNTFNEQKKTYINNAEEKSVNDVEIMEGDELIPIPFADYFSVELMVCEKKSHDINFQSFVTENNK